MCLVHFNTRNNCYLLLGCWSEKPYILSEPSRTHGHALVHGYFRSVVSVSVSVSVSVFVLFFIWRVGIFFLQPEQFGFKRGGDNFETP